MPPLRVCEGCLADATALDEPLLGSSDDEGGGDEGASTRRGDGGKEGSSALVPYSINAYDWADLLRSLAAGAASGFRSLKGEPCAISRALSSLVPHSWGPAFLHARPPARSRVGPVPAS